MNAQEALSLLVESGMPPADARALLVSAGADPSPGAKPVQITAEWLVVAVREFYALPAI